MEVKFLYGAKGGAFQAAIIAAALNAGKVLRRKYPFVSLEVPEWSEFLSIVWRACADCSRDSRGQEIVKGLPVSVFHGGKEYFTRVWYDVDAKGLRYVSLY